MRLNNKATSMKVIDEKAFSETFQYFDKGIVLEIIDIFIQEHPARIESIRSSIANRDFTKLKFDAHSMKGVIANFFAATPQNFAKELETKGTNMDDTNLELLLDQLEASTHELVEDLNEMKIRFAE